MKLKHLSAVNMKGSTFEHELADVTVFHGRNKQGKSTRLEALALATVHEVPGPPRICKAADIFDSFASGPNLICHADADTGHAANACWNRDRKGKVETTFGGELKLPALLFNVGEFLDLTPKERTRFLFSVLPPPPLDKVGPDTIVAALKNFKAEPHTEAHESAVNGFCTNVREHYDQTTDASGPFVVQEWLEALFGWADTETKALKQSAKTMRSTQLGTTALRTDAPALGPVEAAKVAAQAAHSAAVKAETEAQARLDTAVEDYRKAKKLADTAIDPTAVERQLAELKAPEPVAPAGLKPTPAIMQSQRPHEKVVRGEFNAAVNAAQNTARAMVDAQLHIQDIEAKIQAALNETTCPTCGHDITDQKKVVIAELKRKLGTGKQEVGTARQAMRNADKDHRAAALAEKDAGDALEKVLAEIKQWDAAKAALDAGNQAALDAYNDRQAAWNTYQTALNGFTADQNRLKAQLANNGPAHEAWVSLPALEKAGQTARVMLNDALIATTSAASQVTIAEERYKLALADAAAAKTAQQAADQAIAVEAKAEVGQVLRDLLDTLLQESIRHSVGPLLELVNSLCSCILPAPLQFTDGEVTMQGYAHRTFSGTEKTLVYAALAVGLAAGSPVRLVVLDEFDIDEGNFRQLVSSLAHLIADGKLDQAIMAHTTPTTWSDGKIAGVTFKQIEVKR